MEKRIQRGRFAILVLVLLWMLTIASMFLSRPSFALSSSVVISQVYGGGGNSGATYKNDFIELFNRGNTTINLNGWSVQYASATGTTWQSTIFTATILPGQYFLIQQAAGTGGTINLPMPDAIGTIAMNATAGKIALVNNMITLSGACPTGIVDFVGYGSSRIALKHSPRQRRATQMRFYAPRMVALKLITTRTILRLARPRRAILHR